jgi:hypothetical protein
MEFYYRRFDHGGRIILCAFVVVAMVIFVAVAD